MSDEVEVEKTSKGKKSEKIRSVSDLPGVGPATAKKLSEAGYDSLEAVATASVGELKAIGSLGDKTAVRIIEIAKTALNLSFETADILLEKRKSLIRITTGSEGLDTLFGGGIESGSITEFFGEFRTGKTQIGHQVCVTAQLPVELGGFATPDNPNVKCIYIDTEGTFRPERLVSMVERYEEHLDVKQVLKNILHGRSYNSDFQMALAQRVAKDAQSEPIKVLIVDSLTSHFRAEYLGRGTLAARQQKLNQHIHVLLRLAEVQGLLIIASNQVHAKPDVFFGDPIAPVGGHIVAHASQTRVYLRKSKGNRRIARISDSPLLPESETVFAITESGIVDP